jgi:hypothetical protein
MLAFAMLFGYAATAGAVQLYRGEYIEDTRRH